jgi:hypothetical protein
MTHSYQVYLRFNPSFAVHNVAEIIWEGDIVEFRDENDNPIEIVRLGFGDRITRVDNDVNAG